MKATVRNPRQERAIEKKNKIIEASYELFSEVGYYGTNTAEIAKKAGVSTGIVYGYFQDKRDILISVMEKYIKNAFDPVFKLFDNMTSETSIAEIVKKVIEATIKIHKKNAKIHETLHSLTPTDEVVNMQFIELENKITIDIAKKLQSIGINTENPHEKIHFAMNLIQSFAHEYVFDKHDYIDYIIMRDIVTKTLTELFSN